MREILKNLALMYLTNFCVDNGFDCSGSYCVKIGRGFKYSLRDHVTGEDFMFVTFHKSQVPTFMWDKEYFKRKKESK